MKRKPKILKAVSFTDRKRRYIWAAIFVVISLFIILSNTGLYLDTYVSTCVGTRNERTDLIYDEPLIQRFVPKRSKVEYIQIHIGNVSTEEGVILFSVEDHDGNVIFSEDVPMSSIKGEDAYLKFDIDQRLTRGETYYFKIRAEGMDRWHVPKVWLSDNVKDEIRDVVFKGQPVDRRLQTNTEIGYSQFHYSAYIISLACILISGWTILLRLSISEEIRAKICRIIIIVMPLLMFIVAETLNDGSVFKKKPAAWIINYFLYAAIYWLIFAICNHLRFTVLFSNVIIFIIAVINYYKMEFRGEPFSFTDIVSFKTAMNVASEYQISLRYIVITTGCVFILITAVVSRFRYSFKKIRKRIIMGGTGAAVIVLLTVALFNADRYSASKNSIMQKLGIVNNVWNQPKNYTDNGLLVAITMNAKYLTIDPPSVYSKENLDHVIEDIHENYGLDMFTGYRLSDSEIKREVTDETVLPNVICIMDESYSDFSQFGDFDLTKEYSPFIDSLAESGNVIKGDLYVSTYGGGTANSEFEFLTGNTMVALPQGSIPYQQYIDSDTSSLPRIFKELGYKSIAVHPYLGSGWNRPQVYEHLAFDEFYDIDSFEDLTDEDYIRSYVSDRASFEKVIELYEQNKEEDPERPLFIFNVTMQNHGGYTKSYANFEPDVFYSSEPGKYKEAEQYFSVARNTDDAVKYLVEYFAECGEPTVICFFGDHLPSLKDGFYENILGVKSTSDLTADQMEKLYMTDFFIWANYPISEGEVTDISLNYLSTLMCQSAGIPMSQYQLFLTNMYRNFPVLTTIGVCDYDGTYLGGTELATTTDIWNYYSVLEYNNIFEEGDDRVSPVFDLPFYLADGIISGEDAEQDGSEEETEQKESESNGN